MRWLITGGCGFIGVNLVKRLLGIPDIEILIIDNLSVGSKADLNAVTSFTEGPTLIPGSRCHLIEADIMDAEKALIHCQNVDVVVHLAANTGVDQSVLDPRKDCEINVIGTFNYLEAAKQASVKRFIFASSGAPVGEVIPPIHEEMPAHPVSPYGASKLAGEAYCSTYFRTFGLETVALRFGNIYGPGSSHKGSVVAKFLTQILSGETIEIYGSGNQTRDFIYIGDLIEAIYLASTAKKVGGEIYQIASNSETTVNEMLNKLTNACSKYTTSNINTRYGDRRLGDVERNYSDTSKARNELGWVCKTSLETGLHLTTEWFFNHNRSHNYTD